VAEIHYILKTKTFNWEDEDRERLAEIGIKILSLDIQDVIVREFAAKTLWYLSNKDVQEYMPQLIQALKRECYFSSELTKYLIVRSLTNREIGSTFFWTLSSEMESTIIKARFNIIRQIYLEQINVKERRALLTMETIFLNLVKIAKTIQTNYQRYKGKAKKQLQTYLYDIIFPKLFYLPTNRRRQMRRIVISECNVLNSNTKPLWLAFESVNGQKIYLILKVGDDIRVDVLALQLMKVLDGYWKQEGLDLHLQPYVALPLGNEVGIIEVLTKTETISSIGWKHGGETAASAFNNTSLKAYLHTNNPPHLREVALRNFALSCAGYCVFTYIFGVGDRHGDNIMCTKTGNLFHIDFGYFLGERTKFLGISRETNAFVLTLNYINAMGKFFEQFVLKSCQGFAIALRHKEKFVTLISLMRYILTNDQVNYIHKTLQDFKTEVECRRHFYHVIQKSLQDKRTILNEFAHLLANKSG
jgi:phosphatidylinositol kinase/protein kinase (PI-3  family)